MLKPSLPSDAFQPGDLLNNTYRIEGVLGRGFTSEVYLAQNALSGQVALKVLKSKFAGDDGYINLTKRELEIRQIRHDAIVGYRDGFLTAANDVCIVMDYVVGPTLAELVTEQPLDTDDLVTIADRLADGLSEAHRHGIIHRDLSPDNVILRNGDPAKAVIIDFGIAKDTNPGAMTVIGGEFAGKYQYAAPEQLEGRVDERSDLYALGACLLTAYRRRTPDIGNSLSSIQRFKSAALDVSGVPEPLRTLIEHLSDPDPEKRFQSADAVRLYIANLETPDGDEDTDTNGRSLAGSVAIAFGLLVLSVSGTWVWLTDPLELRGPPHVEIYQMLAERTPTGAVSANGHVPNEGDAQKLTEVLEAVDGTLSYQLARGAPSATWTQDVISTVSALKPLSEWSAKFSKNSLKIEGIAKTVSTRQSVMTTIKNSKVATLFDVQVNIGLPTLLIKDVKAALDDSAECGPLYLVDPPDGAFGVTDVISIKGKLSGPRHAQKLTERLEKVSAGRELKLETSFLNPALCGMEGVLPPSPACTAQMRFGYGNSPEPNPSALYSEGDNPTIDVVTPASKANGHLYVFVVDVTGNAYSLLPSRAFPETRISHLGRIEASTRLTRVAYSLAERDAEPERLAFLIDNTFGESRIYVIHTERPVFDFARPLSESAESLRQALLKDVDWTSRGVLSICSFKFDSR